MNQRNILLVYMLLLSSIIYSQSILVSGIVVDEGGNPLPGVTVLIEGTNRGASTTFEGSYAIKADNESQNIQFSYIGFETQSILISNQKTPGNTLKGPNSTFPSMGFSNPIINRKRVDLPEPFGPIKAIRSPC